MFTPEEIIAAFIVDRAHQFREGTGCRQALLDVAFKIRNGEAGDAHKHGELDDLLLTARQRRAPKKKSNGVA